MNTKRWILVGVLGVIAIIAIWMVSSYNGLVTKDVATDEAWANVEAQYQRRVDLIPNLVETVKGYATHEQLTLLQTVEARAKSIHIDPQSATDEQIKAWEQAQNDVKNAINVTVEAYPQLQASQNFATLQVQLERTENRILESRKRYNESLKEYNTALRSFPTNIIAGMFGFTEHRDMFTAQVGAEVAPKVEF